MNSRCYQITLRRNIFTPPGALRSVDRIVIVGAPVWRWLGGYVTLGRTFYSLLLQQEAVAAHSYCNILWLIAFLKEVFIRNTIITLCFNPLNAELNPICHLLALLGGATIVVVSRLRVNYITVVCINSNNNYYRRFRDLNLVFKIPMGTLKNFFEIYRQFGHAPSKSVASPGLVYSSSF
jgi:hypothetical protein